MTGRFIAAIFAATLFASAIPTAGKADPVIFSSGERQVMLLELFTSEGCSSCPPADKWLGGLRKDSGLWTDFVPVAFHVDYWDYIGWRDRFARPEFSTRQRRYAKEGAARVVYTPGLFRGGREWRNWFRNRQVEASDSRTGNLSIVLDDNQLHAQFDAVTEQTGELQLTTALLGMNLETRVRAGENAGKTLRHDFVVLDLATAPLQRDGNSYTADLHIPESHIKVSRVALAAWVAPRDRQMPLQATGGFLN